MGEGYELAAEGSAPNGEKPAQDKVLRDELPRFADETKPEKSVYSANILSYEKDSSRVIMRFIDFFPLGHRYKQIIIKAKYFFREGEAIPPNGRTISYNAQALQNYMRRKHPEQWPSIEEDLRKEKASRLERDIGDMLIRLDNEDERALGGSVDEDPDDMRGA